jgi:hypothetical protein
MTASVPLADNNFGDTMSGGLAGPMGLFVILVLAIGTVLLIRNMNTRLRRLPDHFPVDEAAAAPGAAPAQRDDLTAQRDSKIEDQNGTEERSHS